MEDPHFEGGGAVTRSTARPSQGPPPPQPAHPAKASQSLAIQCRGFPGQRGGRGGTPGPLLRRGLWDSCKISSQPLGGEDLTLPVLLLGRVLPPPELVEVLPEAVRYPRVNQGNMPGLQSTFLAMDTEEGVEVVWNELQFTDKTAFTAHEETIKATFEQLVVIDHPNIVKVHKYWLDVKESKAQASVRRVIFITEYVSSGSLKQFLKKTKKNHKGMSARAWKRWCTQMLSALSYLHSCDPPIIHGNLTSDTIFIQHNGLIKIGSVWHRIFAEALPPELHSPCRTEREDPRNLHFFPPEYGETADGTAVDIFSFGMCALEMAVLEIQSNGDSSVTKEAIERARHSLDDPNMREFILGCLLLNPSRRPTAHDLLFHRVLFEVHSLKLLAAHCFIVHQYLWPENVVEEKTKELDLSEVFRGLFPGIGQILGGCQVVQMQCNVSWLEERRQRQLTLLLILEDKLHRQLSYDLLPSDNARDLAAELVQYGFIRQDDWEKVAAFLEGALHRPQLPPARGAGSSPETGGQDGP
ncbi:nuclear receptor-binding protein 2 isoform 3-T3 [Vipera latastei]